MSEDLINKIVRRTTKESSPKSKKAKKYKCIWSKLQYGGGPSLTNLLYFQNKWKDIFCLVGFDRGEWQGKEQWNECTMNWLCGHLENFSILSMFNSCWIEIQWNLYDNFSSLYGKTKPGLHEDSSRAARSQLPITHWQSTASALALTQMQANTNGSSQCPLSHSLIKNKKLTLWNTLQPLLSAAGTCLHMEQRRGKGRSDQTTLQLSSQGGVLQMPAQVTLLVS